MCFIAQRQNGNRTEYLTYKINKVVITGKINKAEVFDTFEEARDLCRKFKYGTQFIPLEIDDSFSMKNTSISEESQFVFKQEGFDWGRVVDAFNLLQDLFNQREEYIKYLNIKLSGVDALIGLLEHKIEEDKKNGIIVSYGTALARHDLLGEYRVQRREIKNEICKASKLTEEGIESGGLQDVYNFHNNPEYINKTLVNIDDLVEKRAEEIICNNTYKLNI